MYTNDRIAMLQARMEESHTDLVAIGPTMNMHYLLGFVPHADERTCLLLVDRNSVKMVVPDLNREEVAAHTSVELYGWTDTAGPKSALKEATKSNSIPWKIAIDGATRSDFLLNLLSAVTPAQTITAQDLMTPLRIHKSNEEIEKLFQAASQADRAMQAAIDACRVGVSEKAVAWAAETAFRQDGAEEVCFTIIASGSNGAFPHHHSGERKLQSGDAVVIDIGASLNGYKSDITRMVFLGEPPKEFLEVFNAVLKANQEAMAAVCPGRKASEIDQIARTVLDAASLGTFFTHRTGHGLGLDGHEPPWIMSGDSTILEEGMVFSIEPGVYLEGKFGVRIEDIVVVTQTGVKNLTGFDHSLVIKN